MFKLVIQDDEGKTTVVPLVRDEITIGRKEGNTIRLTERNVSRKHAKISRNNGAVAIEDLGSYNGVRVNGTRISQRTVLAVSDRVQIGDYLIELKAEGVEQPVNYEDARTQPIERFDAAQLVASMAPPPAAPAAVPMSLADTDPTARAVTPAAAAAVGGHGRLVVLSSNFAGRDFPLAKPETVIGRTEDNDVVINHRSISRNHAKVVREPDTGRYTIMDLQSSNGVRVNGEDYGKVELRRGDTVDLGHVRFRFVEPGEDFVFGRDAQIVDVPTAKSKSWLFALLGLVVVGGVVAVVASSGGGGKKKNPDVAAVSPGAETPTPAVAAGTAGTPGAGTPAAGTDTPGGEPAVAASPVAKLLEETRAAIDKNDWAKASDLANEALKAEPGNVDARTLADQAKSELAASFAYDDFRAAASKKQYEDALAAFEKIPLESTYKNDARDAYDRLHNQYVSEVTSKGQALAKSKKCKELDDLATKAGRVFGDAADAVRGIKCEEQVATTRPGGGNDPSGTGKNPSTGKEPSGDPAGGKEPGGKEPGGKEPAGADAATLISQASSAAMNSQYGNALALAERALKANPTPSEVARAVSIAALSACRAKQTAKAKTYYNRATTSAKQSIRSACLTAAGFDPAQ
ncbi:MAG: FHA domain-containing protein [Kofleriaceae bacterium]